MVAAVEEYASKTCYLLACAASENTARPRSKCTEFLSDTYLEKPSDLAVTHAPSAVVTPSEELNKAKSVSPVEVKKPKNNQESSIDIKMDVEAGTTPQPPAAKRRKASRRSNPASGVHINPNFLSFFLLLQFLKCLFASVGFTLRSPWQRKVNWVPPQREKIHRDLLIPLRKAVKTLGL